MVVEHREFVSRRRWWVSENGIAWAGRKANPTWVRWSQVADVRLGGGDALAVEIQPSADAPTLVLSPLSHSVALLDVVRTSLTPFVPDPETAAALELLGLWGRAVGEGERRLCACGGDLRKGVAAPCVGRSHGLEVTVAALDHRTCSRCGARTQLDGEQATSLAGRILDAIDHDKGTLRHELSGTIPLSRRRHGSVVHLQLLPGAAPPPSGPPGDYCRSVMIHSALLAAFEAPA